MFSNIIFVCLLLLVPDLLVWTGMVDGAGIGSKIICSSISLVQVLFMLNVFTKLAGRITRTRLFFICFLMLVVPKAFFALVGWPCGWWAGVGAAVVLILIFAYGFICGWVRLKVRYEEIAFPTLPKEFDGYRILQFSDLTQELPAIEKAGVPAYPQNVEYLRREGPLKLVRIRYSIC